MTLSWNEVKERAARFAREWAGTANEEADAKPFLVAFFEVFGISSKRVATFEQRVKKLDDKDGYIDLLWKGMILVEMKSRGKNLDQALGQAKDYLPGLKEHELPRYILVSDFEHFRLYDLEDPVADGQPTTAFRLDELASHVQHFGYLLGYQKKVYQEQDPANVRAAELLGKFHDRLEEIGYTGHPLEVYLVRVLFCLFAEDTTIFNKQQFQDYLEQRTQPDGSDLAAKLQELFQVLNTPPARRFKNLDEQLADFPYVNGKLFDELLPTASFDSKMRQALLNCCYIDWSKISPAIFGSMFQSVMNPAERRHLGAHYTSEANIAKLIRPLFLDELWREFASLKENKQRLAGFHQKISGLKFLDPACGCGNFLIITYRELRLLEFEILKAMHPSGQAFLDVGQILQVSVDQFYGIEYEEFPARIAEVAMWLTDHQMNMRISQEFGQYFVRLPLTKAATIVHGDALEIEWQGLLNPLNSIDVRAKHANIYLVAEPTAEYGQVNVQAETYSVHTGQPQVSDPVKFDYIIGNPPFIGSKVMSQPQRDQVVKQFDHADGTGVLDYVTAWYVKAAKYIQGSLTKVAFVSTNSIVQGEQTGILWGQLLHRYGIKIHFAHRTFKWSNEARGKAAVYCVIVGFANYEAAEKRLFDYEDIRGEAHEVKVKNLNPYLVDAKDVLIYKRTTPLGNVPGISKGNQPTEGGNLILSETEKNALIGKYPNLANHIKMLMGAEEFLYNEPRYCFWFPDHLPPEFRDIKELTERLKLVRAMRLASPDPKTRELADTPYRFREMRNYSSFVIIPSTTSENRKYIPMGFGDASLIPTNLLLIIPNASLYHFGILTSLMHMAWVRSVCGRLESRYRYSKDIVYNNFPWPQSPSDKQVKAVEAAAQQVLDARRLFPDSSLADLYDPVAMPAALAKAHLELDKAVDLAYRPQPFGSEASRLEFLFGLYEQYTAGLFAQAKPKRAKK
jgi:type I restriction-modification system DNA methylase subunit